MLTYRGDTAHSRGCGRRRYLSPVRLAQACQPCARATGNPDLPTGAEYFARRRKPRSPLADFRSAAGRKQPIVFSARCHGWCGSQKNTGVTAPRDHGMVGHFAAAVPGQRPPRVRRQLAHAFDQHAGHRVGLVPVGSRDDHGVAGGAVDEGGDRRWARLRIPDHPPWPATSRVSAWVGRSWMQTMLRIRPRPCQHRLPRGRRFGRSVRRR